MDKKITYLLLAIFVLAIFLSSYISLGNSGSTSTTTVAVPATAYAQGAAKAEILGYSTPFDISVGCSNQSLVNETSNSILTILGTMEANNSVSDFYNVGTNISITPQNVSAHGVYNIYSILNSSLTANQSACITPYATLTLGLPDYISMSVGTQSNVTIGVPPAYVNSSIFTQIKYPIGANAIVKVYALVTANGTMYGQPNIVLSQ